LGSDASFIALITAAPGLRSLSIISCECSSSIAASESVACASALELEDFQLVSKRRMGTQIGHVWLSVVSKHGLASLTASLCESSDVPFWQAWIDQAGPVMRKLIVVTQHWDGASRLTPYVVHALITQLHSAMSLDLSPLTTLRELIVNDSDDWRDDPGPQPDLSLPLPLLCALETVSSPSLERATLVIDFPLPALFAAVDWSALRGAFEAVRARSPRLRIVIALNQNARDETRLMQCERIAEKATAAHQMEEMVFVE
jgi:hypothetical protein